MAFQSSLAITLRLLTEQFGLRANCPWTHRQKRGNTGVLNLFSSLIAYRITEQQESKQTSQHTVCISPQNQNLGGGGRIFS